MRIYIVTASGVISSEGYADFESAKKFVLGRSDKPKMVAPWKFVSDTTEYKIHDIHVREVK
jgi:hypothetical protein